MNFFLLSMYGRRFTFNQPHVDAIIMMEDFCVLCSGAGSTTLGGVGGGGMFGNNYYASKIP